MTNQIELHGYAVHGRVLTPTVQSEYIGPKSGAPSQTTPYHPVSPLHQRFYEAIADSLFWLPADISTLNSAITPEFRQSCPTLNNDYLIYGYFVNSQFANYCAKRLPASEATIGREARLGSLANKLDVLVASASSETFVVVETDNARHCHDQFALKFAQRVPALASSYRPYSCLYTALIYAADKSQVGDIPSRWNSLYALFSNLIGSGAWRVPCLILKLVPTGRTCLAGLQLIPDPRVSGCNQLLLPVGLPCSVFEWCMANGIKSSVFNASIAQTGGL